MRTFLALLLTALLAASAIPALAQENLALEAVTYTVASAFYDGQVAEIAILQSPNAPGTVLTDIDNFQNDYLYGLVFGDPETADRVVATSCEPYFTALAGDGTLLHGNSGGVQRVAENGLLRFDSYLLPEGESPDAVEVHVAVYTQTQKDFSDEEGSFIVTIPREPGPLVAGGDIDLEGTHIASFSVTRGPHSLILDILHTPTDGTEPQPFEVTFGEVRARAQLRVEDEAPAPEGVTRFQRRYLLEEGAPLPAVLTIQYPAGGTLAVDLAAKSFEAVPK